MLTRHNLTRYDEQRSVLSDMLPFETPPSFSNGGFFNFLAAHNLKVRQVGQENTVYWQCDNSSADAVVKLIFDVKSSAPIKRQQVTQAGASFRCNSMPVPRCWTRPFSYRISHKTNEFRKLSIIHPANQCLTASFYFQNSSLIKYYAGRSAFSLRKPADVAKQVYYDDKLHKKRIGQKIGGREEFHKEYEHLASYFTYERYSNIYRFYESYLYQRCERKFGKLLRLDISKCFDSIYTHSLPWALLGKRAAKDNLKASKNTFGGRFDTLLQNMNDGETNGIVIGPEFSRIFAELILQEADADLESRLKNQYGYINKVHYELFRYVDDYFVFYNAEEVGDRLSVCLADVLRHFKLALNSEKTEIFDRPIITKLTIAKNRVHQLFSEKISLGYMPWDDNSTSACVEVFAPKIRANSLIVDYKIIMKECGVKYADIANYTFASLERIVSTSIKRYKDNLIHLESLDLGYLLSEANFISSMIALFEFAFFVYSGDQRVNFTIRITRGLSNLIDALNQLGVDSDAKDQLFKFAHDNIIRVLKERSQDNSQDVETLCWLLAHKKLGRNYRMEEGALADFLGMTHPSPRKYKANAQANILSITTHLLLVRNAKRYSLIKAAIERLIESKFTDGTSYAKQDSELMMLYLDLINCPYVRELTKVRITRSMGLTPSARSQISAANPYWFTNWGKFDLTVELDKKRARQVY